MENNLPRTAQSAYLPYIGNHADFVVDVHQADENGVVPQRLRHLLNGDPSIPVRSQPGNGETLLLKIFANIHHRLVFGQRGDDMATAIAARLNEAFNGEVVGFRGATGPDNF